MSDVPIITFSPFTSDSDAEIVVPFHNRILQESYPRRRPLSIDEFRARFDTLRMQLIAFGINDETGDLSALGLSVQWLDGTNARLQYLQMLVRPDMRRRGLGRALLGRGLEIAEDTGRDVITFNVVDTVPAGEAFARTIEADLGLREHINIVAVPDLDMSMLRGWRSDGPKRAPGYELLAWTDGYPQQFDADIARLFVIADEDMPFEDAAFEPGAATAETVRERLDRTRDTVRRVTSTIRHVASGGIVGFSEIVTRQSDDPTLNTTLTVVHRDHRGHALGKWIKADAILRALDRFPHATHIQTENAFSNAPMLGINDAIGFKPEHTLTSYQASTARIRSYLEGS
ncbi:MAG: GNAT family N-acetyltransferase [Actinomycetota bacterium]